MPAFVAYNATNINFMSRADSIYNGQIIAFGYSTHQKQNYFTQPIGILNFAPGMFSQIFDPDVIDAPIGDQDAIGSTGSGHV
jgi:hypothetical protein